MSDDHVNDSRIMRAVQPSEPAPQGTPSDEVVKLKRELERMRENAWIIGIGAPFITALIALGVIMHLLFSLSDQKYDELHQLQKKFDQVSSDYNRLEEEKCRKEFRKQSAQTQFDLPELPNPLNLVPRGNGLGLGGKFKSAVPSPKPTPTKKGKK